MCCILVIVPSIITSNTLQQELDRGKSARAMLQIENSISVFIVRSRSIVM